MLGKLARWPPAQLLPVLDIFRLAVLVPGHARLLAMDAGDLVADNPGLGGLLARGLSKDAPEASHALALRLLCNCWKHSGLRGWLTGHLIGLLDAVADLSSTQHKAARVALATALLDVAVACARGDVADTEDARIRVLSMATEVRPRGHSCRARREAASACPFAAWMVRAANIRP